MPNGEANQAIRGAQKPPAGNEADKSTHVDAYFKGFHVGFTKRDDVLIKPEVEWAETMIGTLIERGWKPSWNDATNDKATGVSQPAVHNCPVHSEPMKARKGDRGETFYSHARQTAEGGWEYCNGRGFPSDR